MPLIQSSDLCSELTQPISSMFDQLKFLLLLAFMTSLTNLLSSWLSLLYSIPLPLISDLEGHHTPLHRLQITSCICDAAADGIFSAVVLYDRPSILGWDTWSQSLGFLHLVSISLLYTHFHQLECGHDDSICYKDYFWEFKVQMHVESLESPGSQWAFHKCYILPLLSFKL